MSTKHAREARTSHGQEAVSNLLDSGNPSLAKSLNATGKQSATHSVRDQHERGYFAELRPPRLTSNGKTSAASPHRQEGKPAEKTRKTRDEHLTKVEVLPTKQKSTLTRSPIPSKESPSRKISDCREADRCSNVLGAGGAARRGAAPEAAGLTRELSARRAAQAGGGKLVVVRRTTSLGSSPSDTCEASTKHAKSIESMQESGNPPRTAMVRSSTCPRVTNEVKEEAHQVTAASSLVKPHKAAASTSSKNEPSAPSRSDSLRIWTEGRVKQRVRSLSSSGVCTASILSSPSSETPTSESVHTTGSSIRRVSSGRVKERTKSFNKSASPTENSNGGLKSSSSKQKSCTTATQLEQAAGGAELDKNKEIAVNGVTSVEETTNDSVSIQECNRQSDKVASETADLKASVRRKFDKIYDRRQSSKRKSLPSDVQCSAIPRPQSPFLKESGKRHEIGLHLEATLSPRMTSHTDFKIPVSKKGSSERKEPVKAPQRTPSPRAPLPPKRTVESEKQQCEAVRELQSLPNTPSSGTPKFSEQHMQESPNDNTTPSITVNSNLFIFPSNSSHDKSIYGDNTHKKSEQVTSAVKPLEAEASVAQGHEDSPISKREDSKANSLRKLLEWPKTSPEKLSCKENVIFEGGNIGICFLELVFLSRTFF